MTADGRVLRVRYCPACGTWYGAYYRPEDLSLADHVQHFCQHCCRPCEFLDHWPNGHGESRALAVWGKSGADGCGRSAEGSAAVCTRLPEGVSRWRPALGPAQQELGL